MKSIIELKNVSKQIRGKKIIDSLSLSIQEGEVFGLLGPNGAGKTTTIRMIVGLISISSGTITINGKNIKTEYEAAIQHVGAIVENPELYKYLTGYQNLQQVARVMKGVSKEKIDEIIELVGLSERIHDKVKTYSLGMRQRLGIAQSLLHDPKVLILDEPTNGLDPAGIRETRDYLRSLAKEKGLSIIVSSHLLSEMEMMCDRIAIIQKGKLINVQQVHDDSQQVNQKKYICIVNNRSYTMEILKEHQVEATLKDQGIEIIAEREQIPKVIQVLVQHDILIYEVREVTKSLEDRFLEMTTEKEVILNA